MWTNNWLILGILIISTSLALTNARQINIGKFKSIAHGLKSGAATLLDTKRISIKNFYYDGEGPDAWFSIGTRIANCTTSADPKERDDLTKNVKIPDENGSCDVVKKYHNKNILLTLPNGLTFKDVDYVALYCYKFQHNFGYIKIPSNLSGLNVNKSRGNSASCK